NSITTGVHGARVNAISHVNRAGIAVNSPVVHRASAGRNGQDSMRREVWRTTGLDLEVESAEMEIGRGELSIDDYPRCEISALHSRAKTEIQQGLRPQVVD